MSLFESASLVVTPNGTKASKLYAIKPTSGAGDLTVTRATTATRVNSAGLIESVASNVPRLDYKDSTCPSILVEPQRTNLALRSQEFDNLTWTIFNGSVLANQTIAPDGTNTAEKVTMGGAGSATLRQTISGVSNGTVVTFSLYIKQGSGVTAFLDISDTKSTVDITPTANWTRYTYSVAFNSTNNFIDIELRGTSGVAYCYIWGAQLEAGSYATSYISTTSASVTRNADVISKTGISSLIGQTEGTMYFDLKTIANNDFKRLSVNGGSYVNSIFFDFDNTNTLYAKVFNGGSAVATLIASGINIANRNKIAIAYKNNDFSFYVNGTQVSSQSSGSIPSGLANYEFSLAGNQIFEGNINTSALWKTRLTNAELAELTTL